MITFNLEGLIHDISYFSIGTVCISGSRLDTSRQEKLSSTVDDTGLLM